MCQIDKQATIIHISSKNSELVPGRTPSRWNTLPPCTIYPWPWGFNCSAQPSPVNFSPCTDPHTTLPFTPHAATILRLLPQMLIASPQFQKQWGIDSKGCPHILQPASPPRHLSHSPTGTALWLRSHHQSFIFSGISNAHSLLQNDFNKSSEMPLSFQLLRVRATPIDLEPMICLPNYLVVYSKNYSTLSVPGFCHHTSSGSQSNSYTGLLSTIQSLQSDSNFPGSGFICHFLPSNTGSASVEWKLIQRVSKNRWESYVNDWNYYIETWLLEMMILFFGRGGSYYYNPNIARDYCKNQKSIMNNYGSSSMSILQMHSRQFVHWCKKQSLLHQRSLILTYDYSWHKIQWETRARSQDNFRNAFWKANLWSSSKRLDDTLTQP